MDILHFSRFFNKTQTSNIIFSEESNPLGSTLIIEASLHLDLYLI